MVLTYCILLLLAIWLILFISVTANLSTSFTKHSSLDINFGVPSSIIVKNAAGETITSFSTVQYTYIEKITLSCSETDVKWSITPSLPNSLSLNTNTGVISGQVLELLSTTQFNITATNSSGSTSIFFPITVSTCSHGRFIFPRVEATDQGMLILKKDDQEVYKAYLSNSGIINAICLPYTEYDYSFNCQSAYYTSCNVLLNDDDNTVYLSIKAQKGDSVTGKVNFVATELPTPIVENNPFPVVSNEESLLFFSATSVHGNFTFTPALPSTIQFDYLRSSIKGKWTERGIHTFTVECGNEKGVGSLEFSVYVDRCPDSLSLAQLVRKQFQPDEGFNITNSKNEVVYNYMYASSGLRVNLCLPEDEYVVHLFKADSTGWNFKTPLYINDETGYNLGVFTVEAPATRTEMGFSTIQSIHSGSKLRFFKGNVKSKWTQLKFKDSDWSEGSVNTWGVFDASVMYFRKVFTLSSDRFYAHVLLDVLCKDKVTVFVNDEKVIETSDLNESEFTRLSLPSSAVQQGENILAVMIQRTRSQASEAVLFDVRLRPTSVSCISLVGRGEASSDEASVSSEYPPSNAFDDDPLTYWISSKVPSTLFYTFSANSHEVINKVTFYKVAGLKTIPLAFTIQGIRGEERVTLKEVRSTTLLQGTGYATFTFPNKQAFNKYAFIFPSTESGTGIQVNEIALFSYNELFCKKKIGYASIETGSAHFKSCPFNSVGTRQMKCVDVNNQPEWVDDRSACLQRIPRSGIAYVDTSFLLFNVSYSAWETTVQKGIADIITANLVVKANETQYSFVSDRTDDSIAQIFFSLRFTLEEDIGDYVRRHTTYLVNDFNSILTKKFGTIHKGISIEVQDGPHLREPIYWSKIILYTVMISLIVVLSFLLYLRTGRKTHGKKNLLKYKKQQVDEGKHSLLSEE